MFFNSKFSILKAYLASLKINLEYIAFYLVWNMIVWVVGFFLVVYLAVAMDILDGQALMQDYSWIFKYFSTIFKDISMQKLQNIENITGHEPYDILKIVFPENILNPVLEGKSWSEYFNVIFLPKKMMLSAIVMFISTLVMTSSVGYIKTALKFQSEKKASLHDMYQHFYLVPQYFLSKIVTLLIGLLVLLPFLIPTGFLGSLKALFIVLGIISAIFMYQRLRFMQYFIIDKGMSVFQASKASWKLTQDCVFHLLVYTIGSFLLFTHPASGILFMFFSMIYKQADVNVYKQLAE